MKNFTLALILIFHTTAYASSPILRPYQSARAAGMGNIRYTTGLYEENFFANPARAAANPAWKVQIPKILLETGTNTLDSISTLSNAKGLSAISDNVGKPISAKMQMIIPAYYASSFIDDSIAFGLGLHLNFQTVILASNTGDIDPTTVLTAGPSMTIAKRLLSDEELVIGLNVHTFFKGTSSESFGLKDYLSGSGFSDSIKGGSGAGFDFDLGATYLFDWTLGGFDYSVAGAVNNIMGGTYDQIDIKLGGWSGKALAFGRSFNFGFMAERDDVWIFDHFLAAIESTDIGNLNHASLFKTLHIGSEVTWSVFSFRGGINQGYFTGGLGFDLGVFELHAATYGEELGLNAGVLEDRRYVLELGMQF